jgi:xanthine/uracil permease
MVAGGLLAYAGLITLLIAAAIALGSIMPYWLSSLIVGVAVIVIGAIFISVGRNSLQNMDMAPQKTIETLREDAKWAKEQVR